MSEPEKMEAGTSRIPEDELFRQLLKENAPKLLSILLKDPTFLPAAVIRRLPKSEKGNYVISPILIELIMMVVWIGSRDETANEIRASLRQANLDRNELKRTAKALIHVLWSDETYALMLANKIFVRSLHLIDMNFKIISEACFYIYVDLMNFRKRNRSTEKINTWIENRTQSAVKDLIAPNLLSDSCNIVIASSVFFTAKWHIGIDRRWTSKKTFMVERGRGVKVEFMHTLYPYKYYESERLNAKFLELKLEQDDGRMVVVLPNDQFGVSRLEENLVDILSVPGGAFKEEMIQAEIPKYIISTTYDWKHTLQELGINRLFTENQAQIIGIAGFPDDLHVNHLIQKVVLRVGEPGVETTTVFLGQKEPPMQYPTARGAKKFIANHPFLFYVKIRGVILFIGRLVDPSNSDDVI